MGLEALRFPLEKMPELSEDVYEPYLVQNGLICRNPARRMASDPGIPPFSNRKAGRLKNKNALSIQYQ